MNHVTLIFTDPGDNSKFKSLKDLKGNYNEFACVKLDLGVLDSGSKT